MCKIKLELLGVISERAVILEALIADRLSWSKFRDNSGRTYCYFTVEDVAEKFQIGLTQAKQAFKELETAGIIIRCRKFTPPRRAEIRLSRRAEIRLSRRTEIRLSRRTEIRPLLMIIYLLVIYLLLQTFAKIKRILTIFSLK